MNKLLLFCTLLVCAVPMLAQQYTLTDDDVVVEDGVLKSCSYDFAIKDIIIPDVLDGQAIVEIGSFVFESKNITGVSLPSGLITIGWSSFTDNEINQLLLPDNVEIIESNAFNRNNLSSLELPLRLKYIGGFAFSSSNITEITIPQFVEFIGSYSFSGNSISKVVFEQNSKIRELHLLAFSGNAITNINLPSNSNDDFLEYYINDVMYAPGDLLDIEDKTIYARTPYTLKAEDVNLDGGIIKECFYDYSSKYIVIPNEINGQTITGIGASVFSHKGLLEVTLPGTLESVGFYSFYGNEINKIELPNTITYLDYGAFRDNKIKSLVIPSNLEVLETQVFHENEIIELTIPSTVRMIKDVAFGRNKIEKITFAPNSNVQFINLDAFWSNNLTEIVLPSNASENFVEYADESRKYSPESVISLSADLENKYVYAVNPYTLKDEDVIVEDGILKSCSFNFDSKCIIIPEILDNQVIKIISSSVFEDRSLCEVKLPSLIEEIGAFAFQTNNISSIELPAKLKKAESYAFCGNRLTDIVIPREIHFIGNEVFAKNKLTSYILPDNNSENFVEYNDGANSYRPGDKIDDLTVSIHAGFAYTLTDDDVVVEEGVLKSCSYDFSSNYVNIPKVLDGQTVVELNDYVFSRESIKSLTLPSSLKRIGESAFEGCGMIKVDLPQGLEVIGENAFNQNRFVNLTIPNTVTIIKSQAFYNNNNLKTVVYEEGSHIQFLGNNLYWGSGLQVTLPTNVSPNFQAYTNGQELFAAGDILTSFKQAIFAKAPYTLTNDDVVVEDGILKSCSYNFESKYIIIPNELDGQVITQIGNDVFKEKELTHIQLPDKLKRIQKFSFNRNNLSNIDFPVGITEIDTCSFEYNVLVSIQLPAQLLSVYQRAFGSNNLTQLDLPESLEEIGTYAFDSNPITNLNLPSSIQVIKSGAFQSHRMSKLFIPKGIHSIGAFAFYSSSLAEVEFETNSSIQSIDEYAFGSNTAIEIKLPTNSNSDFEYYTRAVDIFFAGNVIANNGEGIYAKIPYTLSDDDVVVKDGILTSCNYSFHSRYIKLPQELDGQEIKVIESDVFKNKGIVEISLPHTLEVLKSNSLSGNQLYRLTLPYSIKRIDTQAIVGNNLTSLDIPQGALYVGTEAFIGNPVTAVNFFEPSRLLYLGKNAFGNDSNLKVYLPKSIYQDFSCFEDEESNKYSAGDLVDFTKTYITDATYLLQDNDVIIEDGVIKEYIRDYCHHKIEIPTELQSQIVIGIDGIQDREGSLYDGVFRDNNMQSVKLPNTITKIGKSTFRNNMLSEVILPYTIEVIDSCAFLNNNLNNLNIPASIISIRKWAFSNNKLNSIVFESPGNLMELEAEAFSFDNLTSIQLPAHESDLFIGYRGGYRNVEDGEIIVSTGREDELSYHARYAYTLTDDDVTVEDGIITSMIEDFAQSDIIFPNELDGQTIIGVADEVFSEKGILSVDFPNTIQTIGKKAFCNNYIENITFPSSITRIERQAFGGMEL